MSESKDMSELAAAVLDARARKEEADGALKDANAELRAAEHALADAMFEQSLDAVSLHGHSFARVTKVSVKRTDPDALFAWLESNGYGSVVKMTVHPATLTKVATESVREDGVTPDGIELSEYTMVQVRRK